MRLLLASSAAAALTACAAATPPDNVANGAADFYMAERADWRGDAPGAAEADNLYRCRAGALPPAIAALPETAGAPMGLSPGDLLTIDVADGDELSGAYVVGEDGRVDLPYASPVAAAGGTPETLGATLEAQLEQDGIFQPGYARVSVELRQWAAADVQVAGAVFQPGRVRLNDIPSESRDNDRGAALGDAPAARRLTAALRAAAGVRPDADIEQVVLVRDGTRRVVDLTGALTGAPMDDLPVRSGDQVYVPEKGCFQQALARPSAITAPGIRVFMSNLTRPAASNASSAIGKESTELPYGTRLLQGLVSANCVGGTQATNAGRHAVLISQNPVTGRSEVIHRPVEALVRRADRDDHNPVLLPGDAIACYDSAVTNVRDVLSLAGEVIGPAALGLTLQQTLND